MKLPRWCLLLIAMAMAAPARAQVTQDLIRFHSPIPPESVAAAQVSSASTTEYIVFAPAFGASHPATSVHQYQWQRSTDSGSTWHGPDGTATTYYAGPTYIAAITAGTLEARCRSVTPQYPSGTASAWVFSGNVTYAPPFLGTTTSVGWGSLPSWLNGSVSNPTTTPALSLSAATGLASHNAVLGTDSSGNVGVYQLTAPYLPTATQDSAYKHIAFPLYR